MSGDAPHTAVVAGVDPKDRPIISVIGVLRYRVDKDGRCTPDPQASAVCREPEYYDDTPSRGRTQPPVLRRDVDTYAWKRHTDLVVQGTARWDKPVQQGQVVLSCVGPTANIWRTVQVFGDRWVERGAGRLEVTVPEPLCELPVRHDRAYGGVDTVAEGMHLTPEALGILDRIKGEDARSSSVFGYPRNQAGKGYLVNTAGVEGLELPNLELPDHRLGKHNLVLPLDRWGERPCPACFDWVPHAWFPRVAFLLGCPDTHDGQLPRAERALGIFDEGFMRRSFLDGQVHGFAQGGNPMVCRQRLRGEETITVSAMSGDGRELVVRLPGAQPVARLRLFRQQFEPRPCSLDTVFVQTEEPAVTLTWRASFQREPGKLHPKWEEHTDFALSWP